MSKHNRNQSQRPAVQEVSTRPSSPDEAASDVTRVPSPATAEQSADDAAAADPDRYQAQPGITATDPLPGEPNDVEPGDDDENDDENDDEDGADEDPVEEFQGFEDLNERPARRVKGAGFNRQGQGASAVETLPAAAVTVIHRSLSEQEEYDSELVPIIPRVSQQRLSIGGEWYNLVKGMEQFVPRAVADHLRSKGVV